MEELKRLAEARDKAAERLLTELRADAKIAEYMRDYWKELNAGSEREDD